MKYNILLIHVFSLFSLLGFKFCNGQVDGGSCSYNSTTIPAVVIDIYKVDSNYSEVIFVLKKNKITDKDTLIYSNEFSGYISNEMLIKSEIKVGNKFTYEVKDILTGHCNPRVERLRLEKYIE